MVKNADAPRARAACAPAARAAAARRGGARSLHYPLAQLRGAHFILNGEHLFVCVGGGGVGDDSSKSNRRQASQNLGEVLFITDLR
jgi:hypothetical protein